MAASHDVTVDWDQEAGESWLSLLDGASIRALVHADIPLVFVVDEWNLTSASAVEVVTVHSFDERSLCISRSVWDTAFPNRSLPPDVTFDAFSVVDLWFGTI